uniref:Uncharacterized protein n=1 Tax=Cacopsylla melanoneura TaxID=428564 RepID=A0A8D8QD39_9HEMI
MQRQDTPTLPDCHQHSNNTFLQTGNQHYLEYSMMVCHSLLGGMYMLEEQKQRLVGQDRMQLVQDIKGGTLGVVGHRNKGPWEMVGIQYSVDPSCFTLSRKTMHIRNPPKCVFAINMPPINRNFISIYWVVDRVDNNDKINMHGAQSPTGL